MWRASKRSKSYFRYKWGETSLQISNYLRMALMLNDNQAYTFRQKLLEMITLALHDQGLDKSLTIVELIDEMNNSYGLSFSDSEIIDAINSRNSKVYCTNYRSVNDPALRRYSIRPEQYDKLENRLDTGRISELVEEFIKSNPELGLKKKAFLELLFRYLYSAFNSNAHTILMLINGGKDGIDIKSEDFSTEEKEAINRFIYWDNTEKDDCVYKMVSCCFDYCMMTVRKDNSVYSTIFHKKNFYLDANIIFRLMGLNQEGRKKVISAFVSKCKEAGINLKFTNYTRLEIESTIDHYISEIRNLVKNTEPISPQIVEAYNPFAVNEDFYIAYVDWCKKPQNKIGDYNSFRMFLKRKANETLAKFTQDTFDDFKLRKEKDFKCKCESLSNYKISHNRNAHPESIKIDVNNYLRVLELNDREGGADFFGTRNFIISADHAYGAWARDLRPGAVPIVVLPSVWYSIILQYTSRTNDDLRSFTQFLKFGLSNNVNEKAEIKNRIATDVYERLNTDYGDLDSAEDIVEKSHEYILDSERDAVRREEQQKAARENRKTIDEYEEKLRIKENDKKLAEQKLFNQVQRLEAEKLEERNRYLKEKNNIKEQARYKHAEELAEKNIGKTLVLYWITAVLIGVVIIALIIYGFVWIYTRPDSFFTKPVEHVLTGLQLLIAFIESFIGKVIFNKVLCDLDKDKIKERLIKKYL